MTILHENNRPLFFITGIDDQGLTLLPFPQALNFKINNKSCQAYYVPGVFKKGGGGQDTPTYVYNHV